MRLLLSWVQIHPAIGSPSDPFRIQVGAAQAKDVENFDTTRRWDPDTNLETARMDAAMAANPPKSIAEFLDLCAGELQRETDVHVTVQQVRPAPPPAEPEAAAE